MRGERKEEVMRGNGVRRRGEEKKVREVMGGKRRGEASMSDNTCTLTADTCRLDDTRPQTPYHTCASLRMSQAYAVKPLYLVTFFRTTPTKPYTSATISLSGQNL